VSLPLGDMAATEAPLPDFYETLGRLTGHYAKNEVKGDEVCRQNLADLATILQRRKARTSVDMHTLDAVLFPDATQKLEVQVRGSLLT
jgi:hypothetical protein